MNTFRNISKELAEQALASSVMGGGVAQSEVDIKKTEEGMVLTVHTPSLYENAYHLQIDHSKLILYLGYGEGEESRPTFVRTLPISHQINKEAIEAVFDAGQLKIFLPFFSEEARKPRNINIKRYNM